MGSIRIPCYIKGGDDICVARTNAIQQMLRDLVPEARNMAVSVMTEKEIQAAGAPSPRNVDDRAILGAVDNYVSSISPYISQIIKDSDPEFQAGIENFVEVSKQDGWFMLGSYYWTLARITEHTHELAGNLPTMTRANYARLMTNMWNDPAFAALWTTSEETMRKALLSRTDAARTGEDGLWAGIAAMYNKYVGDNILGPVVKNLTEKDPIISISDFGHFIINAALGSMVAVHGLDIIAKASEGVAGGLAAKILTLGAAEGAASGASALAGKVAAAMTIIGLPLVLFGLFAAFYLPALPWILWMSAMIGWLVLIVETLFAAPLWAVGHLIPEGDGMAGQHGRQGYMLMLGILARPPLMVVGFFASIIIFAAVGKGVGFSLMVYQASVSHGNIAGPITGLASIILLISVMIVFAHKVFGLITHLPENVTKWIGGQATSLGEHQDESRIRGMAVVAGGRAQKAVGDASGALKAGGGDDDESGGGSGSGGSGKSKDRTRDLSDN